MSRTLAIYRREVSFFFNSTVAYAVLFVFLLLSGYFFYNLLAYFNLASVRAMQNPLSQGPSLTDAVVQPLFGNIAIILLLIIPLLTMRLLSDERKSGTAELLFTFPISDWDAIVGKYLATVTVYAVMLALTLLYPYILSIHAEPEVGPIVTGYLGLFLMGLSFVAMGLFFSSLSENQLVAGVATFGCGLLFLLIGWIAPFVPPGVANVISQLSILEHFAGFAKGVVDVSDVFFYINCVAFFLFLTARVLDSQRWRS